MRLLKEMIHSGVNKNSDKVFRRIAARGIILDGENILLMYTKRYNDYSFPGGGVDDEEHIHEGLVREIQEETGAKNVEILDDYGIFEEYRDSRYEGFDIIHMTSHFYTCKIDELGENQLEDYEIKNGMHVEWVNIHKAIAHNKKVISEKDEKMGLSIERETFVLELIANELIK